MFLDIDERRNRLVFGVEREAIDRFTEELQRFLRGTRVPPAAVIVEAAEPIQPMALLTDTVRPVPAGVQVTNSAGGGCTLGANAVRAGVTGFITASHCTGIMGVVDGTALFQSTPAAGNQIGFETADAPFFTGGSCPSGRRCRRSDASFFTYGSASLSAGGKIANPLFWGFGSGTLQISLAMPRLSVAGFLFGSLPSGTVAYKVGRTTGGTIGSVSNTCADMNIAAPSTITMLCQDQVGSAVAPETAARRCSSRAAESLLWRASCGELTAPDRTPTAPGFSSSRISAGRTPAFRKRRRARGRSVPVG